MVKEGPSAGGSKTRPGEDRPSTLMHFLGHCPPFRAPAAAEQTGQETNIAGREDGTARSVSGDQTKPKAESTGSADARRSYSFFPVTQFGATSAPRTPPR